MDKNKRYRLRAVSEGRCPHCGKPCAPFYECGERRFYKRVQRNLRRLEKAGHIQRTPDGWVSAPGHHAPLVSNRSSRNGDRRLLPKIMDKPVNIEEILVWLLEQQSGGVTEQQLYDMYAECVLKMRLATDVAIYPNEDVG